MDFICNSKSFISKKSVCDQTFSSAQLTGELDDCFCDVESIDVFNNFKVFPRIKKLTEKDYFRYYRVRILSVPPFKPVFPPLTSVFHSDQVNLKRPCPFWPDDGHCSIKDCHVEPCPEVTTSIFYSHIVVSGITILNCCLLLQSKIPVGIKSGNYNKVRLVLPPLIRLSLSWLPCPQLTRSLWNKYLSTCLSSETWTCWEKIHSYRYNTPRWQSHPWPYRRRPHQNRCRYGERGSWTHSHPPPPSPIVLKVFPSVLFSL